MSRIMSAMQRAKLEQEQRAMVEQALKDADLTMPKREVGARSAPADERRLRGIPVIGGVGGHIPGTRPEQAIDRIDRMRER